MVNQKETPPAGARDAVTDAERYRYLRDVAHPDAEACGAAVTESMMNDWGKWYTKHYSGEALDALIDQALTGKADGDIGMLGQFRGDEFVSEYEQATQPAAPETTNSTKVSSKLVVGNTAAGGMGDFVLMPRRLPDDALALMACFDYDDVGNNKIDAAAECWHGIVALAAQPAPVVGGGGYVEQHARDSKELRRLCESRDFYKRRCDALQAVQSNMRDPERKAVCDILANGSTELLSARPGGEGDELKAYEAWFDGEQGKAYDGMKAFARAAWIARAAHPTPAGGEDR